MHGGASSSQGPTRRPKASSSLTKKAAGKKRARSPAKADERERANGEPNGERPHHYAEEDEDAPPPTQELDEVI